MAPTYARTPTYKGSHVQRHCVRPCVTCGLCVESMYERRSRTLCWWCCFVEISISMYEYNGFFADAVTLFRCEEWHVCLSAQQSLNQNMTVFQSNQAKPFILYTTVKSSNVHTDFQGVVWAQNRLSRCDNILISLAFILWVPNQFAVWREKLKCFT